jgi:hypothetical protein
LIIRRRGWTFESKPAPESGFRIEGSVMRFSVDLHDTELIGFCADLAHQFVSRVSSFVWKNLQITPPLSRGMMRPWQMG